MSRDLTLAIDGSHRGEPLVGLLSASGEIPWTAGSDLAPPALVRAVLEALDGHRERLGMVLAVRGPGSYMGVRAGLAAALGASQALGVPLSLVGSLMVVGSRCDLAGEEVLALADAGRGGTYGQRLQSEGSRFRWAPAGPAQLLPRGCDWPSEWPATGPACGSAGEGRETPAGLRWLPTTRDRLGALAFLVRAGLQPMEGYASAPADYAEPLGAP